MAVIMMVRRPALLGARLARGLRDYPVQLLVRNHGLQRKLGGALELKREWNLGIELQPSEVKALRARNGDLAAAFAEFYRHELFLHQLHVPGVAW